MTESKNAKSTPQWNNFAWDSLLKFFSYLDYVTKLDFHKGPDYNLCRKFWKELLHSKGHEPDIYFDWLNKKMGKPLQYKDYADYEEK